MTEPRQPADQPIGAPQQPAPSYGQPPAYDQPPFPTSSPYAAAPPVAPGYGYGVQPSGPLGRIRGTGICILLCIVTLGIYSIVWYYKVHDEMKRHSGQGIGGGVALLLALLVGIVLIFVTPAEIGSLRERAGQEKRVSAVTGLWNLIPLVGSIVWFVKTNAALNDYWASQGAQA